jgi:radical SAM/Cys-rich protein
MTKSLVGQGSPLAVVAEQRAVLRPEGRFRSFLDALDGSGLLPFESLEIATLQLNLGKLCNQTCKHCHVDAGPDRREAMTRETMEHALRVLSASAIPVVDLTGGAPEMNAHFRWLVAEVRARGRHVIDRCNLTILTAAGHRDLPGFLASHAVEVVASLPYFLAAKADAQRGAGVFDASITALRRLNALGYGRPGAGLTLNLVYNPTGAFLPGRQSALEADFRHELERRHGVVFDRLFALTNMPINRFLDFLLRTGQFESYMERLVAAYNPAAAAAAMCRSTLSVGWDGRLYDCDFNQMLELPLGPGLPRSIAELEPGRAARRPIVTGLHCFGCTVGAGSSCGGEVACG